MSSVTQIILPGSSGVAGGGAWQLADGHYEPSFFTMEITFPKQGLTGSLYRPYTQPPGVPYNIPVVIFGGAPPFYYELEAAPSGMTLAGVYGDTDYGIIKWTSPTAGTHTVRIRATDQEGTSVTSEYTLNVNTSDWLFVDAVSGSDSNSGTAASPFKTINGYYLNSKYDTTYTGKAVMYRSGTYVSAPAGVVTEIGSGGSGTGVRTAFLGTNKPNIHCVYPGDTATFDFTGCALSHYGSESSVKIWWDGFDLYNPTSTGGDQALTVVGSHNDVMFYNLGGADTAVPTDSNAAFLFWAVDGTNGNRHAISHCRPTSCRRIFAELYAPTKVTCQHNTWSGFTGSISRAFYCKSDVEYVCVWHNQTSGTNDTTVGSGSFPTDGFYMCDNYVNGSTGKTGGNWYIVFNKTKVPGCGFLIGQQANAVKPVYEARNTWHCTSICHRGGASGGPADHYRSIIKHTGLITNGTKDDSAGFTYTFTDMIYTTTGVIDDTTLLLTGSDRTTYLGIRGHEIA